MKLILKDDQDHEVALPRRTREIIRRTLEAMPQIERLTVGQVIFNDRGGSIIPAVTELYKRTKMEDQ